MGILLKLIVVLVFLGSIGLVGYAYLGDMSPEQVDVTKPVFLNAD
jgi:hypothetical protein